MSRQFPILRLLGPIAALAAGLSLVTGLAVGLVLTVKGVAGGRVIGGLIDGVATAVAGLAAAFIAAALGEVAELLLELHSRLPFSEHPNDRPGGGEASARRAEVDNDRATAVAGNGPRID